MARKKARETYGNGAVFPETRNGEPLRDTWRVVVSLGKDPATGKRRKVQRIVHGTLAEARKICKQLVAENEHTDPRAAHMTFGDAAKAWENSMRLSNTCTPTKLRDYMTRLSYASETLGKKPITSIKQTDIERMLTSLKKSKGLSQRTLRDVLALTRRVFNYAESNAWVGRNVCRGIPAPKPEGAVTRRSLDAGEVVKLRSALDRDEEAAYKAFFEKEARQLDNGNFFGRSQIYGLATVSYLMAVRLMLASGMRRGECLGLEWGCVNFNKRSLTVEKSYSSDGILKGPKTAAGVRTLSIDDDTIEHLRRWKETQHRTLHLLEREGLPVGQTDETPVCCGRTGTFCEPHGLARWWKTYRKQIGFPDLKLHELRHTQATLLLGAGVDLKTVQHRLGHSSASLTLDTYAHAIPANDRTAADLVGTIMAQPEQEAKVLKLDRRTA